MNRLYKGLLQPLKEPCNHKKGARNEIQINVIIHLHF